MQIKQIELYISKFEQTVSFYKDILAFPLLSKLEDTADFRAGSSVLTLHRQENSSYYYHFAFNIPPNQFESAKEWVRERVELSTEEGSDTADFTEMKARSFYFEDPAGNIVEYIARRETSPEAVEDQFSPGHIQTVSEIGISAANMKERLEEIAGLGIPTRNNEAFHYDKYLNFMGEYEDGQYIIVGPAGRRWIFSNKPGIHAPVIIKTDRGIVKNF